MASPNNINRSFPLVALLLWFVVWATVAAINVYFRLYPLTIYPEYSAKHKAEIVVYINAKKGIQKYVRTKYAGLPADNRKQMEDALFKQFLEDQKLQIDSMTETGAREIQRAENLSKKSVYLMEADPYYYLGLTRRLLEKGTLYERIKGRAYFNEMMLAPVGAWYPMDYHPYVGYWAYQLLSVISKQISLETAVALVPLFLSTLCIIPFLVFCSRIFSLGYAASFLGALYLLLSPVFFRRSLWGWYDTDSYNILFPLLILYGLCLYVKEANNSKKRNTLLIASGLAVTVYSLFWQGWLLEHVLIYCAFVLSATVISRGKSASARIEDLKNVSFYYLLLPISSTALLWGWEGLASLIKEAAELGRSFFLPVFSPWPDIFLTVGELRHSTFLSMLKALGGIPLFALFLLGIFSGLKDPATKNNTKLIAVLFACTGLLAISIERFALLAVVPSAIGAAMGTQCLISWTKKSRFFSPSSVRNFICAICLAYTLWQGHLTARFEHPIFNTTWDKAMTYLRVQTPEASIVTSWWCPGHFISSVAKRRVTFDGATQNTPQAYWVANLFLESSEEKSAAILRMLNLSGSKAVELLTENKVSLSQAVSLIHRILPLGKAAALDQLKNTLNPSVAMEILGLTHSFRKPPPSYVFIYNDMVEQAMALEYAGNWDFSKAEHFLNRLNQDPSKISKRLLERSSRERVLLTWSLSKGPYAQDEEAYEQQRVGQTVYFANGLTLNLDSLDARLSSKKFGLGIPQNVYFLNNGQLEKKYLNGANLPVSVLLIKNEKAAGSEENITYRTVLADQKLIESLLFRMYYLKGEGLNRFKLIDSQENAADQTKLYLYQVLWD